MKTVLLALVLTALVGFGCSPGAQTYSGIFITREIENGFEPSDLKKVESVLGQKMPVPTYLPYDYQTREVYLSRDSTSVPPSAEILLLISDLPIRWADNQYTCRIAISIGWNHAGLGLKMPWAEYIPEVSGRLEHQGQLNVLWWESYGTQHSVGSTLKLYANPQFSKDEMIKIAASTPTTQ